MQAFAEKSRKREKIKEEKKGGDEEGGGERKGREVEKRESWRWRDRGGSPATNTATYRLFKQF